MFKSDPRGMLRLGAAAALAILVSGCGASSPIGRTPEGPAPQITCGSDLTVRGVLGATQVTTFDNPLVSGGTAPVGVTCTPASGAAFSLGTTTVQCVARDASARQAACTFAVTLNGLALGIAKFETVGDSLTAGENGRPAFVDTPNAYPTRLQEAFDTLYPGQGIVVTNRGHSGDSVQTTLQQLPDILRRDRPDVVLLLSGFNDLGNCSAGSALACATAISDLAFGIRDCIRRSKESSAGIKYVFVSTLTPPGPVAANARFDRRIPRDAILRANDQIRVMVRNEGATLVDTYPLFVGHEAEFVDSDGLHLQPAGYQALADSFLSVIRATVPQSFGSARGLLLR